MDSDGQAFPILSPYPRHPTNKNRMNTHQQPLRDHRVPHPTPRQYTTPPEFQDNHGNEPQPSVLQNTPRYHDSSRPIKQEQDLNTYIWSTPTEFRGEMNLNVHHPTHADHNTIRYPASHNTYSSDSNTIRMASSRLETPDACGPAEAGSADFCYQIRALQPQQHPLHSQRHQHGPLPHHQHQNRSLNHLQGGPVYSPPINYSSQDQEHSSPSTGGLDQPPTQLGSLEYDSRESHAHHVPVPGMVYDSLGVRRDTTMNHHGSLASINSSNSGSGSYYTTNSPASSIPMSNNHGTTSSMNTSVLGAHISPSFGVGPSNNSRWAGHPSGFDMASSTATHSQVPALSPTSASTSASSSLRPSLRHAESDSRSTPESPFTQDNFHLRASTSVQTLSSSYSHTNSPSPMLSDNESSSGGRHLGSEMVNPDDRKSDQDVEKVTRMSKKSSAGRKGVTKAGEKAKETPVKKKKKSKMHCCEVCLKKFPRPSGLRTHMNTHSKEKPFPCGFPGCTRSFGVRSNAKRHLRTHGVIPAPATNSTDPPYIVGFCPPIIGVPSHQYSQLHSIDCGEDYPPGSRLLGDNANIHTQGRSDLRHGMSSVPLTLRWMPQSLTTRTNAGSLREVVDEQQMHWMGDEEDGEDDDDFAVGGNGISHIRRTSGGYDMDVDQGDIVEDGDKEFGEDVSRLNISPRRPVIPSSSTSAVSASSRGIRLSVPRPTECMYSPPCSESPTQRTSSSSSRIIASISPSSTSFARSNSSLSPAPMSGYGRHEIDVRNVRGGDVYTTRIENISREYGI